jgi:hypothetical protein
VKVNGSERRLEGARLQHGEGSNWARQQSRREFKELDRKDANERTKPLKLQQLHRPTEGLIENHFPSLSPTYVSSPGCGGLAESNINAIGNKE